MPHTLPIHEGTLTLLILLVMHREDIVTQHIWVREPINYSRLYKWLICMNLHEYVLCLTYSSAYVFVRVCILCDQTIYGAQKTNGAGQEKRLDLQRSSSSTWQIATWFDFAVPYPRILSWNHQAASECFTIFLSHQYLSIWIHTFHMYNPHFENLLFFVPGVAIWFGQNVRLPYKVPVHLTDDPIARWPVWWMLSTLWPGVATGHGWDPRGAFQNIMTSFPA